MASLLDGQFAFIASFLDSVWLYIFNNDVLLYGVAPVAAYIFGYSFTMIPLEIIVRLNLVKSSLISYTDKETRVEALKRTDAKVPVSTQIIGTAPSVMNNLFGPLAILSGAGAYFLFQFLIVKPENPYPTILRFLVDLVALELSGDFGLYWGHRVQHDIPYLWEHVHSIHHQLETPTPLGTIYIHSLDAALQGTFPLIFAALVVRPHVLTFLLYIYLRVAENVVNHSGINSFFLNLVSLKFLPFRASIAHHDAHHKYSHYGKNAKNYAEFFWIWDYLFGTLRSTNTLASKAK